MPAVYRKCANSFLYVRSGAGELSRPGAKSGLLPGQAQPCQYLYVASMAAFAVTEIVPQSRKHLPYGPSEKKSSDPGVR